MWAVNPIKKRILKTYCIVHKYINLKAIELLASEGYQEEYDFYRKNIRALNEGVVWADQDFKSSNHFYHMIKGKGLFGFSDALTECKKYYNLSIKFLNMCDLKRAMFYLGAACHLVQDSTVPQHANNKLLKKHRKFELWIIDKIMNNYSFEIHNGIKQYPSVDEYIKNNAIMADDTYKKFKNIKEEEIRYEKISDIIVKEAERTTAGFLLDYYKIIKNNSPYK